MKRQSIIRKKQIAEAKCSSSKNRNCRESLTGLQFPSGIHAHHRKQGLHNRLLHRTQTLKGG